MSTLENLFKDYNDEIMLHDSDYEIMREKRDLIIEEIRGNLDDLTFLYS